MKNTEKQHWENVYDTKGDKDVSWYEELPATSLNLIMSLELKAQSSIIDVGGGSSNLAGALSEQGMTDITVLDISGKALERARAKLGQKAENIRWAVSDVLDFRSGRPFDVWHDRATFHFLTLENDIAKYVNTVAGSVRSGGHLVLATFSSSGPEKCSGLEVRRYSDEKLQKLFDEHFRLVRAFEDVHRTPFNTEQNFIYALFRRR